MANNINVKTNKITRDKLARAVNGNHELIKLLENITADIETTLPNAINTSNVDISTTLNQHTNQLNSLTARIASLESSVQVIKNSLSDLWLATVASRRKL